MSIEIPVPSLGESVSEATVAQWLKKAGDAVATDETIAELETDKVTLEVNAPSAGVIAEIKVEAGGTVVPGDILAVIGEAGEVAAAPAPAAAPAEESPAETPAPAPEPAPAAPAPAATEESSDTLSPAVRKMVAENNLDPALITGTGKEGRLTKGDVIEFMESGGAKMPAPAAAPAPTPTPAAETPASVPAAVAPAGDRHEERVKMTKLRQTIAKRLKEAQNTAAILTTFNDVDMTNVMELRTRYRDEFEKKHGVRLGFMSFFLKAAVQALKAFPAVNGEVDGNEVIYKNYYDIGVAVGTDQGLVVPVVRNVDKLTFAEVEQTIADFGERARVGKIAMDDLMGGTFTISNGGVYGSLMSTPIINPPQSAILGMHRIEKRAIVVDDEIKIRPMMYLAMSYDHRIIDGTESVRFLKTIKEAIEDPQRLLLSV